MKYLAKGFAGLLVAVVLALLIVPALVNWNGYRAEIATKAAHVLGRPVEIHGDIGVSLLPTPTVTIERANLGNIEGASDADMLSLDALEVKVAWAPLLIGSLHVDSVKLVRPVFSIEIFEGGETNLELQPRVESPPPALGAAPSLPLPGMRVTPKINGGVDVSIDNVIVEKGAIVYRNARSGIEEHFDDINGRVAFASLKGPVDASIRGIIQGLPVTIDISAGEIIQGRTLPFNLDATIAPGSVKAQFSGSLNGLDDLLRLRGRLTAEGENLRDFLAALGVGAVPDALRRPFGLQTNMTLAGDGAELGDVVFKLDGSQAQGRVTASFADKPTVDAAFTMARLDLDALTKDRPAPPPATKATAKVPAAAKNGTLDLPKVASDQADGGAARRPMLEKLPAALSANVAVGIDAVLWRGEAIRQAKLDLSLANREITVSQLSAVLPGNSDVAVFGFVTEKDALPQFDGTFEATSSDMRGVLAWLGVPVTNIASDRLRNLSMNARLSVRPDQASASDLKVKFDATQIDGAVTVSLAQRPSFGANLVVDRINLDAYLTGGEAVSGSPAAGGAPSESSKAAPPPAPVAASGPSDPVGQLLGVGGIDANLRTRVGALTVKGLPMSDVRLDATLADGTVNIKSASIGDLLGIAATVSGEIGGLNPGSGAAAEPRVRDFVVDIKGKSVANLFRALDIKSPVSADALGAVAMTARADGTLRALDLSSELQAMGGHTSLNGRLDTRQIMPRFDAKVSMAYPDAARFVRGFGTDWRPRGAKGPIDATATISGTPFEMGMSALAGSVAGVRIAGTGAARLPLPGSGRKPLVALNLATGDLDIDSFLPQKRVASLDTAPSDRQASVQKASFRIAAAAPSGPRAMPVAASAGNWSTDPLDLTALSALDGSFAVKSESLRIGGITVANADLDAELQNGLFEIRHFTGKAVGGDLTVDGGVQAEPVGGRFELRYALNNADVGATDRALGAKDAARGRATFEGQLRGNGRSNADLVASLSGEGTLAFRGIDGADGQGSVFAAVGGIAQSLERLGGLRGRLEPIPINLSGPYRVERGVVAFDELAFTSPMAEGALKGKADLPKWQIAATGEIRLAKEFVIGGAIGKPVPFSLEGALDAPRLKVDIAALPGGGVQIPLDKLTTKKGATEVLKGLLPRPAPKRESPTIEPLPPPGEPAAAPRVAPAPVVAAPARSAAKPDVKAETKSEAKPEAKSEPKKGERVEDILKDILRGTSR